MSSRESHIFLISGSKVRDLRSLSLPKTRVFVFRSKKEICHPSLLQDTTYSWNRVPNMQPAKIQYLPMARKIVTVLAIVYFTLAALPAKAQSTAFENKGLVGVGRLSADLFDQLG